MALKLIRGFFVLACMAMGCLWSYWLLDKGVSPTMPLSNLTQTLLIGGGCLAGCVVGVLMLLALSMVTESVYEKIFPVLVAIVIGMVVGYATGQYLMMFFPNTDPSARVFLISTLVLLFGFMGISLGLTHASKWESVIREVHKRQVRSGSPKIVDTSVIIDGRISGICDSGFLDGTLIIPRFILHELQSIADSADVLRRAKGRRGLDILKEMQEKIDKVFVMVVDDDYPEVRDVDAKLLRVAKDYGGKVITNDFNLNKVAQIEGVSVLNINDLANAIKPAVLPDEQMQVKVIKEGKEPFQGVGYLDDGTMVVVDGGKEHIGKTVAVVVTSVLQTAAGRMIFGKMSGIVS